MKIRILKSHWQCRITEKGFTLIEVLLALFIGSLVLVTLYASFFQIIKSKEFAESELEIYHEARVINTRISEDLASLYLRGNLIQIRNNLNYESAIPIFEGSLEGDNSFVRFTALSRDPGMDNRDSDQALISYYVLRDEEDNENTDLYKLYRSENPYFEDDSNVISYPISDRVMLFRLNYLDGIILDDESFSDSWNSKEQGKIPNLVELVLVLKSPRDEEIKFRTLIKLREIL